MKEEKPSGGTERRVLIVDDDKDFAESLVDILESRNFIAAVVSDENGLMGAIKDFDPAVALLDIRLGRQSGIDLLNRLKETGKDITCVMVTAYASVETALEAMQHGAYDYLKKPINIPELLSTLERCFEKIQLEQEKKQTQWDLFKRLCYEEGLAACSHTLLTNTDDALRETLHHLLTASGMHRVYLYENFRDPLNRLCMRPVHEVFYDGGESGREMLEIPYVDGFSRWEKELSKGKHLSGAVRTFPKSERDILAPQGVLSILVIPVMIGEEWYGFIGFDDMESEREWTKSDVRMLLTASEMIGTYINRRRSDEAVRKSEEQYRLLANSIKDVIWTTDLNYNIIYITPSIEKLTGFTVEEVMSSKPEEILSPASSGLAYKLLNIEMENILNGTFRPAPVEMEFIRKDGSAVVTESTVSVLYDDEGRPLNILGVTRDITERKKAEAEREKMELQLRQSQKMEAIGTLAGGIAHDFNNILSGIYGYTELALGSVSEKDQSYEYLKEVLRAANRARELIKQILLLSRQQDDEFLPVNIGAVIEEAVRLVGVSLPPNIAIETHIDVKSDVVLASTVQIHQIIMNLFVNAVHSMRDGPGILKISLKNAYLDSDSIKDIPDLIEGQYVELEVGDTGHGIPREHIDKIFDPFFTTKEKGEGSGLGLSVILGIVKNHGGAITVQSEYGRGTSFRVYLPTREEDPVVIEKAEDAPSPGGNERVLLVDDELTLSNMEKEMLRSLGYEVTAGTDSREVLELFKQRPMDFDIVVTDYNMPEMTGTAMAGEILDIRPDIPVILCTGFSEHITPAGVKAMGIRALLHKPLTINDLAVAVRRALDGGRADKAVSAGSGGAADDNLFSGKRILVADDMASNRHLLKLMLGKIGCESDEVENGEQALVKLRENVYDLVFMDINMPVMDGIDATKSIRTELKNSIPVVAITGSEPESGKDMFLDAGINDFLKKPIEMEGLKTMLRKWTR